MEMSGRVIKEMLGKGSKSEHQAVMLDTGQARYVLRRQGGNPFREPELDKLVGKVIRGTGNITGYTFIMSEWSEIEGEAKNKSR